MKKLPTLGLAAAFALITFVPAQHADAKSLRSMINSARNSIYRNEYGYNPYGYNPYLGYNSGYGYGYNPYYGYNSYNNYNPYYGYGNRSVSSSILNYVLNGF